MTVADGRAEEIVALWKQRKDQGEALDPQDLVAQYPEFEAEIRLRLAALEMLDRALGDAVHARSELPTFRDYRVVREIGRGAMGVVYEAEQVSMRRLVALKVLYPAITLNPKAVERFRREAQAAGHLHHTNIVPVYGMGEEDGTWFYAMERIEGRTLCEVIADLKRIGGPSAGNEPPTATTPFSTHGTGHAHYAHTARSFAGLAEALEHAHSAGIVHRDLKPSNVLLDRDGTLKLTDFGLARTEGEETSLTLTGEMIGTPAYMSPEQVRPGATPIDGRTDVFSLGATLYEFLTLRPPFAGKTLQQVFERIATRDPAPLRRWQPRIPRDLETVVLKALEKDPARRYQTAGDLASDLRLYADGSAVRARRAGPLGRAWRTVRRHRLRSASVATILVLATAAVAFGVLQAREHARRVALEYDALLDGATSPFERSAEGHDSRNASSLQRYGAAIALAPERPEAYLERGLSDIQGPDADFADFDRARQRGLSERTVHLARAFRFRELRLPENALAEERLAGTPDESDPASMCLAAGIADLDGRSDEALRLLGRVGRGGRSIWARMALSSSARVRLRSGDFDGALTDLVALRALQTDGSTSALLEVRLAQAWLHLGRSQAADECVDAAIAWCERAGNQGAWDQLHEACQTVREWPEPGGSDPWSAWCLRTSALAVRAYPLERRFILWHAEYASPEEGIEACDRLIAQEPRNHDAYCKKGRILILLGNYEAALPVLLRAGELPARPTGRDRQCEATMDSLARAYEAVGRTDEALRACEESLRFDRQTHAALYAELLVFANRLTDAKAVLDRAIAASPKDPALLCRRGFLLLYGRDDVGAVAAARAAVQADPNREEAQLLLCSALLRVSQFKDAVRAASRAIELAPADVDARTWLAYALQAGGQPSECLSVLDKDPATVGNLFGLFMRARARAQCGRLDEALADCDEVLRQRDTYANGHALRGFILYRLHRPADQALSEFQRALALDPIDRLSLVHSGPPPLTYCQLDPVNTSDVRGLLGLALSDAGRFDDALAQFELSLADNPRNLNSLRGRPEALDSMGRLDQALQALKEASDLVPGDPELDRVTGTVLAGAGRFEEALPSLRRTAAREGLDPKAHMNLGAGLAHLGAEAEALEEFRAAEKLAHGDASVWSFAAAHLWNAGHLEEALQQADESIRLFPGRPDVYYLRGCALLDLGMHGPALRAFEKARALGADQPVLEQARALTLARLGRFEDALGAVDTLEKALAVGSVSSQFGCLSWNPDGAESVFRRWVIRATCLRELKRGEEALSALATLAARQPGRLDVVIERVVTLLTMHRDAEARALAARSTEGSPPKDGRDQFGWLAAVADKGDLARESMTGAPEPSTAEAACVRARTYALLGDREQALRWLAVAAKGGATFPPLGLPDPSLSPLEGDARYAALRERMTAR